jgi:hypothetical protein
MRYSIEIRSARSNDFPEMVVLSRQLWPDKPINPECLRCSVQEPGPVRDFLVKNGRG